MATCKDCLHDKLCSFYEDECGIRWNDNQPKCALEHIEKHCTQFKDRSRFVEVSCKVGDRVYYIANVNGKDEINSAVVQKVTIHFENEVGYDCGIGEIGFSNHSIGKRVFLTKEQAEQVLKERESE